MTDNDPPDESDSSPDDRNRPSSESESPGVEPGEPSGRPAPGQGRPTMSPPPEREQTGPERAQTPPQRPPSRRPPEDDEDTKTKMIRYLYWGAFGLLFLFGAFAAFGFYRSVMRVIDIWVAGDFQPIFRALFNLVVVLVSVLGLSLMIRRMDVSFSPTAEE